MGSFEPIFIHIHEPGINLAKLRLKVLYETQENTFNPIDANPFCTYFLRLF